MLAHFKASMAVMTTRSPSTNTPDDTSIYRHMFLYQGQNANDETVYAYLAVDADKVATFAQALRHKKSFKLQDYGTVVEAGYGIPPEDVKKRMSEQYFFDPNDGAVFRHPDEKDENNG
jgi:hypothetical protein